MQQILALFKITLKLWHSPSQVKNDFSGAEVRAGLTQASSHQTTTVFGYQSLPLNPCAQAHPIP